MCVSVWKREQDIQNKWLVGFYKLWMVYVHYDCQEYGIEHKRSSGVVMDHKYYQSLVNYAQCQQGQSLSVHTAQEDH